ncbi:hypothetical protein BG011_009633 [Mortierella polycephala]|uniref:C2 domain-containing protein n=1 Tax=Mortierella polycephala TaxID=41804 RepID=A0A9P6PMJ4_9FUNG|nr:hypothetical protein BG011_009633 [Mortierella polycephala]
MTTPKIGVLVAIPIKGRKLMNRSGGKQSPYVQLTLGEQKKRTRASLIASVRLDVFQGQLDMHVTVYDEGKKNELIGDGALLLHEVIDKGELDVWFPIKYNGSMAGDIYFELTFYAAVRRLKKTKVVVVGVKGIAPPPDAGATPPPPAQTPIHTPIRHTQPGFQGGPGMHPMPHTPPTSNYGSPGINNPHVGASPTPFAGNMYQQPAGFSPSPRPFPPQMPHQPFQPQQPSQPGPYGGGPSGPGYNQQFGNNSPFRPPGGVGPNAFPNNTSPQFGSPAPPGPYPNQMPQMPQMPQPFNNTGHPGNNNFPQGNNNFPQGNNSFPQGNNNNSNNNNAPMFPVPQHQGQSGQHMNMAPNFPQGPGGGGPPNTYPNNNAPNSYPNQGPNNNYPPNGQPHSFPNNNFNNNNNNNNNFNNNAHQNSPNNNNLSSGTGPGVAPVTPLMQYNYSLESFP